MKNNDQSQEHQNLSGSIINKITRNADTIFMATIFLVIIIILSIAISDCNAQNFNGIGVIAGAGLRTQSTSNNKYEGLGYKIGIITSIQIEKSISIEPEINYTQKGFNEDDFDFNIHLWGSPPIAKLELMYIDLCIPAKFKIAGPLKIATGLQLGFLIDAEYSSKYDYETHNVKDYLKSYDLGFLAGLELEFKNGLGCFVMTNAGLIRIDENKYWGRNFLATAGLYYLFRINPEK